MRASAPTLVKKLSAWFVREKRDLPWRRTRDPYRIWISEAMLQQTRVETAIPYYERFLERFPTVEALAGADEDSVLAAWSGLGYYRRARALRAAAQAIVERHGGRLPDEVGDLLDLPGVGPYTAGAVASIAFGKAEPLVDGNVTRVLSRVFGVEGERSGPRIRSLAKELVTGEDPGTWNQALMELGALVCLPREPRCDRCPIAGPCVARREGKVEVIPAPRARPTTISIDVVVLAASKGGRWLLERRPSKGRMAGLWQLPTVERRGLLFPARRPARLAEKEILCEVRHTITRHRIRAVVKRAELGGRALPPGTSWVEEAALPGFALTGMTRKCFSAILAASTDRGRDGREGGRSPSRTKRRSR
jgi:A/G-specific adenine glycosylase